MAANVTEVSAGVGQFVRPEFTTRIGVKRVQYLLCCIDRLADPHQEPDQRAFDHWAQGHPVHCRQPRRNPGMMLVLGNCQCDQHVCVEEIDHQSSSRAAATSSEVTRRPMLMTGKPETASVWTTTGSARCLRARGARPA